MRTLENIVMVLLLVQLVRLWWQLNHGRVKRWMQRVKDHRPRKRHPKSPKDCPHCCAGVALETIRINADVRPWYEVKNKRGRKKQYATQGLACLNRTCRYYGVRDEGRHALVRHTLRGKDQDIPYLRCQCCKQVFSSRRGTPLYYLKTKPERVEMVLWFLVEGVDMAVLVRYTGHKDATIARWLERMGQHSQGLHNVFFRGLVLAVVQLDELYAKVRDSEKPAWLWLAIDPVTKIIPSLHLGERKSADAYGVVHDLAQRLLASCVPVFLTDGLWSYFYAITAHFGYWFRPKRARTDHWSPADDLHHGQLVKRRTGRKLKYAIERMAWGSRRALGNILVAQGFSRTIQTAYVERVNLTFRQCIAGLARKTWSLMSTQQLRHHSEWFRLYYHFARPHRSLREQVPGLRGRYRARTPAMAAGLTDHIWTVREILHTPLLPVAA